MARTITKTVALPSAWRDLLKLSGGGLRERAKPCRLAALTGGVGVGEDHDGQCSCGSEDYEDPATFKGIDDPKAYLHDVRNVETAFSDGTELLVGLHVIHSNGRLRYCAAIVVGANVWTDEATSLDAPIVVDGIDDNYRIVVKWKSPRSMRPKHARRG